jgi:uncharacterized Zn finger protein (UPF0148 family)
MARKKATLGNTHCAVCRKPLGFEATRRGKTMCKKHRNWALANHITTPEEMGSIESIKVLDENFVAVCRKEN